MHEEYEHKPKPMARVQKCVEVNPLLHFLGLNGPGRRTLSPQSQLKRVVLSPEGGALLQSLAKSSRVRVYAALAFLECAAAGMDDSEIVAFLKMASDNQILEKVLAKVEGPGTCVAPGLKAALKQSEPLKAPAIGILNRLIAKGCNPKAALAAAGPSRHFYVRGMLGFAEIHNIHPLAKLAVHLCSSEREVLALDALFQRLEQRAPSILPRETALLKLENFNQLSNLLQSRIQRYRGNIQVPEVSHPCLTWVSSIPQLHAVGREFRNCLNGSLTHTVSLVLGRSFIARYTHESTLGLTTGSFQYVLLVTQAWENGAGVFIIQDAKYAGNQEMSDSHLAEAIAMLSAETGFEWRLSLKLVTDELLLHDWQNAFDI